MNIINISVKNRSTIFVLLFAIIITGIISYINLPLESFPEVKFPLLIVRTFYFGVAPADIESLITNRIESKLKTLNGLKKITSQSMEGLSLIRIEFLPGVNIDVARQKVKDKVDLAKSELPEEADDPLIEEINIAEFPMMYVSLYGEKIGLYNLKNIAEGLKDKIKGIKGVLDVEITGGLEREIQVNVDPNKLRYYKVSLDKIVNKIAMENITLPGGNIEVGSFNYSIRLPGEIKKPEDMFNWIISEKENRPVHLKDVAAIEYKYKEIKSISRMNGYKAVTLGVKKRTGENIVNIADSVKQLLKDEKSYLPSTLKYSIIGDQSKEINKMVKDLENNIICALILVVAVIFLFLGFKNSLFIGLAIPLSMLIAFSILTMIGITLNMVVLVSLILALGMLVDNAIVLVENIYRHRSLGEDKITAAIKGANEIAIPITTSTLTTLSAFLPLLFWPGIMGNFMSYMPKTVMIVLGSSLFVALTIIPVICSVFMNVKKKENTEKKHKDGWFIRGYRSILLWSLKHRWTVIILMILIFVLSIGVYIKYSKPIIFFPVIDPERIIVEVEMPLSTRIELTDKLTKKIEPLLKDTPDMVSYLTNVGVEGREETHKATLTMDLKELLQRSQNSVITLNQLRDRIKPEPGVDIKIKKPHHGPPTGADISVELSGEDFNVLKKYRNIIKNKIADIPGLINLRDDFSEGKPEIKVHIDRELASRWGLSMFSISNTVRAAIKGLTASKYRIGEDEYDITVRFKRKWRNTFNDLKDIIIFGPEGRKIPLSNLASFDIKPGYGTINHKNQKRMVTIDADAKEGSNAYLIRKEVIKRLSEIQFPRGYMRNMGGEDEEQRKAQAFLKKAFLYAIFLIAMILVSQFNSVIVPFIIIFSVVLSTMGVLWGLLITNMNFSTIMTGLGLISLAGIVVNNAIVLIDFIEQTRKRGVNKITAIVKAGTIRMRPVLLTATTTLLGLIPMATGITYDFLKFRLITESESSQWWKYMCVAVIFGLAIATILTLIVVPVIYSLLDGLRGGKRRK